MSKRHCSGFGACGAHDPRTLVLAQARPHTGGMLESLLPLVLVLAAFWLWQNALRARERARELARGLCARAGVQLLDETVAVQRLRLRRVPGEGLRLERR
jgi:hypothetical protein